ncbi:sensor histidine kinase [Halogeometricum limi]|uniref:sensor histidine kinase n=1 Tax=Halogeometricum limi TaxID=555875 RepID=UPI001C317510|nr:histidine kinase N-terminal 7TM domain-containing protein [Halogeometricum limi]
MSSAVAVLAWRRRRTEGAFALAAMMVSVDVWIVLRLARMFASTSATTYLLVDVEWLAIGATSIAWFSFALTYTGRRHLLSRGRVVALCAVVVLVVLTALSNGVHGLFRTSTSIVESGPLRLFDSTPGPLYWVAISYVYGLIAAGVAVLAHSTIAIQSHYRRQAVALLLAAVLPTMASLPYVLGVTTVDATPYVLPVSGVVCLIAVQQYSLLDAEPLRSRVVREMAVDQMDDAVVVVDDADRIVDANASARSLLSMSGDVESVQTVFPADADLSAGRRTVRLDTAQGGRLLDVSVTPLSDTGSRLSGRIVVLRDVTERRVRTQHLSVLNRVIRHNLRNRMTLVMGYGHQLDGPEADLVVENARQVTALGNKAVRVQRFLEHVSPENRAVAVESLGRRAVEPLRGSYPEASISVETAVTEPLACAVGVREILHELVENAVRHAEHSSPTVDVRLSAREGMLCVRVEDDGPGLPPMERAVLTQERESPLEHGSGLGLWMVRWGVSLLGGTLACETKESGTVMTVRVPVSERREAA